MAPTPDSVSATSPPPPLPPPHFVIVPFPAQGHTIPMVDLARLLAERGARASLVVTPVNAARLRGVADHAARAKLPLEIVEVSFSPSAADAGLPPGVENVDQITDYAHFRPFFDVMRHLAAPLEAYLRALPRWVVMGTGVAPVTKFGDGNTLSTLPFQNAVFYVR
uniref:Glycosyltransferase n=1 Tax=Oryza barthii TaxID=65489 RepID=A0A0D3F284_9ORYZ